MNPYIDCSKVYIDKSTYGLGVFAKQAIAKGEIVERGLMFPITNVNGHKNQHLHIWSDDHSIWASASGCLTMYNHSGTPNIKKNGDLTENTMEVIALRDIRSGEELCNTYYSRKWRKCFADLKD